MKLVVFFFFITMAITTMGNLKSKPTGKTKNTQIKVYTDFLAGVKTNPVDYVMGLYDTYDIIIFCERDHRELTQYDFLLSLFKDERFINTVGNVFTEIGVSNMTTKVNSFLTRENLAPEQVKDSILKIYRDFSFFPLWEKYNYFYLLESLYDINKALPLEKKIRLYPSDPPFSWSTCKTEEEYNRFMQNMQPAMDSITGYNVISRFQKIQASETRKKAFVILNFPHAYMVTPKQEHTTAGQYIYREYPKATAGIIINTVRFTFDKKLAICAQNGKWDAAFSKIGNPSIGFDLKGSPFAKDTFDLRKGYGQFTYGDMFTGFIFYKPLREFRLIKGIPGIVDDSFMEELKRRERISGSKPGELRERPLKKYYNELHEYNYKNIKRMQKQIKQYLKN